MKLRLNADFNDYLRESEEIIRAFSPYIELDESATDVLTVDTTYSDGVFAVTISDGIHSESTRTLTIAEQPVLIFKKLTKRLLKSALYLYIKDNYGLSLPYGDLTGVRPTKLLYEIKAAGGSATDLVRDFFVREDKAQLLDAVLAGQKGIYSLEDSNADVFLNIPFCPTRCAYCSFISTEYARVKKQIPAYIDALVREARQVKRIVNDRGLNVRAVYVGGGTPTVLDSVDLKRVLAELKGIAAEFTVEGGRPDTIDREKLDIMAAAGVTRLSVNPQTFKQSTLDAIGRKHSVEDIVATVNLAKEYPFVLNMDLIAGLSGETQADFIDSVRRTVQLNPENVTLHSLALKRGSKLNEEGVKRGEFGTVDGMLTEGHSILTAGGYEPYYLYRLKNTADNLENTGYAKAGTECVYNVDIMEDTTTVLGIGAGAMSKSVVGQGARIDRLSNPKGLHEYLERLEDVVNKKERFFL